MDRYELAKIVTEAEGLSNDVKSELLKFIRSHKKFGLVWEDKPEEVEQRLVDELPVLTEVKDKAIICDDPDAPNHILIEGDNLEALTTLAYTHEGKIDVIYIDPPYNTGARDWKYNNDYVDSQDSYKHSKWLSMMYHRLRLAKTLLNIEDSVLIVTIDEKEFHHLGCLLEELFPSGRIQMISTVINVKGVAREQEFSRVNEYIYIVQFGNSKVESLALSEEWLGNVRSSGRNKLRLGSLLRSGSNSERSHSPGCFYPIFFTSDGKYAGTGEPIPLYVDRNDVVVPDGLIAIWPIHSNGSEGVWQYGKNSFERLLADGFVYFGKLKKGRIGISYAPKGVQNKIKQGLFKISGYDDTGTAIIDDSEYVSTFIPGNQWSIPSHNATEYGSKLLKDMFGTKVFTYPKSLYAVKDTLKFFVASKPNATILDFFAGSGTTLHATMNLNDEDGNKRQCILVTNNENNICQEVTYERNKKVIQGYTNSRGEQIVGLNNNNLRYYKTDFVSREQTAKNMRELMRLATDMLCIKNDVYTEAPFVGIKPHPQIARYFENKEKRMLVIYQEKAVPALVSLLQTIEVREDKMIVYVFSPSSDPYSDEFEDVMDMVSLCALPNAILETYKKVLPKRKPKYLEEALAELQKEVEAQKAQMVEQAELFNGQEQGE